MELTLTGIYPFIKDRLEDCQILKFAPGDYIARATDETDRIYYLIEGRTKEVTTTQAGKLLEVDRNVEDEFTGHLSNHWGQNFYCDTIAVTRCTLVYIPKHVFRSLLRDTEFQAFFYRKTSTRLYEMYKLTLAREVFTQAQILAYHLCNEAKGDVCSFESIEGVARELHVSRRNLYNLIGSMAKKGIIERIDNKSFRILDRGEIDQLALPVRKYMMNEL